MKHLLSKKNIFSYRGNELQFKIHDMPKVTLDWLNALCGLYHMSWSGDKQVARLQLNGFN